MLTPEFCEATRGEIIIKEGTLGDRVYLLTEGEAQVLCQGVPVGRVYPNQIFGVKSALTGCVRTATVQCDSDRAFVMTVSKDEFKQLIAEKPELAEKLLLELFKIMDDLNLRIVAAETSSKK